MSITKLRPPTAEELREMVEVATGHAEATHYFSGARIVNVYTGEILEQNLALKGERIAYVGHSTAMIGPSTQVIDLDARIIIPGFVEPHAHPFGFYHPAGFFEKVLSLGTTTIIADTLPVYQRTTPAQFARLLNDLAALPLNIGWAIRVAPQTASVHDRALFAPDRIRAALALENVVEVAELTDWPALLDAAPDQLAAIALAKTHGQRIDGHTAGASAERLTGLSAAGVTACHEAIRSSEVLDRLRAGLYVMLRHSSLRPDLAPLLADLPPALLTSGRLMLTTDGPSPYYLADGFTNKVVRIAIELGVPPVTAIQMATHWPACYFHLDELIGAVAPGRYADLVVLDDLQSINPLQVWSHGELVAERQRYTRQHLTVDWADLGLGPMSANPDPPQPDWFRSHSIGPTFPVMQLVSDVITRIREEPVESDADGYIHLDDDSDTLFAALLARSQRWVTSGLLRGFARNLDALATSLTIAGEVLALGKDPVQIVAAVQRLKALGGGIVVYQRGELVWEIALPLGGICPTESVDSTIETFTRFQRWMRQHGYPYDDIVETLNFLSFESLPDVRLTPAGLWQVKKRSVRMPARSLEP